MPKRTTILACATLMCLWATGASASLIYDLQAFAVFQESALTLRPPAPVVPPPVLPETSYFPVLSDGDNNTEIESSLTVFDGAPPGNDSALTEVEQETPSNGNEPSTPAPVPEPSAILLLGAGLGALAIWKRKKLY